MADATTAPVGAPKISIGSELKEETGEFLGIIGCDAWEEGKHGLQWHLGVKPVDFAIGGKTGMFSTWYKPSDRKSSKMGAILLSMASGAAADFEGVNVGFGDLLGKVAVWKRINLEFGKDKTTGEPMVAEDVLVVVRAASADEKARAASGGGPAPAIAAPEYTDEQIECLISIYAGSAPADAKKTAAKGQYAPEIKNAVFSGAALEFLTSAGLVVVNDGKVELATETTDGEAA